LHRNRTFAVPAKLSTSEAINGNLPVRRGATRHWNDKGALRMNVGMRVRGGLLAALIMVAIPVAASLAALLVSSPAAAQTVDSIQVEGNRRVEVATIRSYFKAGPGGRLDQGHIDDGLKALIETGLFQDVKINQAGGHLVVTVVENPVIGRVVFEGNKKVNRRSRNHRTAEQPRRSDFHDHRGPENRHPIGRVHRQRRLFVVSSQGCHQDPRIESAELPGRQ